MGKKAKKADIIDFLRNIVTVNSNAYKKHVRAKRGTYTEIALPDALKTNSDSQKIINRQAKLVFDKIKEIGPQFKDGKLWSLLLSALRKNGSAATGQGYLGLDGFDVRKEYPSSRILMLYLHPAEDKPYFVFDLFGEHLVDIQMCILEVDATFEMVVGCYTWEFSLEGSGRFNFEDIAEHRVGDDDGAEGSQRGGEQIKEFVYDVEKKGRYVGIISMNKIENGELRTVLAMRAMKLVGF